MTENWLCNCGGRFASTVPACLKCGAQRPGVQLALPGTVTVTSLVLPEYLNYEEWEQVGRGLRQVQEAWAWWFGDWLLWGERKFGEESSQAIDADDHAKETRRAAAWVAARIDPVRRRTALSWSHHKEVASLDPESQDWWLDKAMPEEGDDRPRLTRTQLRAGVREYKALQDPESHVQPPEPGKAPSNPLADLDAAIEAVMTQAYTLWPEDHPKARQYVIQAVEATP